VVHKKTATEIAKKLADEALKTVGALLIASF
jgi:hypothetical protein